MHAPERRSRPASGDALSCPGRWASPCSPRTDGAAADADGYVDTIHVDSGQGGLPHPGGFANEYAAMPSFHVGWTVLAERRVMPLVRQRRQGLLFVPAP